MVMCCFLWKDTMRVGSWGLFSLTVKSRLCCWITLWTSYPLITFKNVSVPLIAYYTRRLMPRLLLGLSFMTKCWTSLWCHNSLSFHRVTLLRVNHGLFNVKLFNRSWLSWFLKMNTTSLKFLLMGLCPLTFLGWVSLLLGLIFNPTMLNLGLLSKRECLKLTTLLLQIMRLGWMDWSEYSLGDSYCQPYWWCHAPCANSGSCCWAPQWPHSLFEWGGWSLWWGR